jgi:type VI secretion system protein ImpG
MALDLYGYYERELTFIRQLSQEFARQYPAAAGRLLLESNRSLDPHVERMIESFALLAGRVHQKLDDEFPELTASMLGVLYPHYLAPIPSMSIVQFELDYDRAQLPQGFVIERGSRLSSPPVNDVACRFQTAYPVHLWPVQLTAAKYLLPPFPAEVFAPPGTAAAIRLRLACRSGLTFPDLGIERMRFFLSGGGPMVAALYEALFNQVTRVALRSPEVPGIVWLEPEECLAQVGFGRDEGLFPYPETSFVGYRLLTEYFAFPDKFLFLDVLGLDRAKTAGFQKALEVIFYLSRSSPLLEQGVGLDTFRQGCTPIVNLFEQTAEPISLAQTRHAYRVVPDVAIPHGTEVYSVNQVLGTDPVARVTTEYYPFYATHHGVTRTDRRAFWYASRRPSLREGDRGTEVELSFVDLDLDPRLPAESTVVVRTTCTNRDLPSRLHHYGDQLTFGLEAAAPLSKVRCVRLPTAPLRPPSRRGAHWRLISHLCLNHLSISDSSESRQALREILALYDYTDPSSGEAATSAIAQIIDGISAVESRRVVGWLDTPEASGFCRGIETTIEFDEKNYVGTGVFLFASVLERFLGLYVSINSFSQLVARLKSGKGLLKRWSPRAGEQKLL